MFGAICANRPVQTNIQVLSPTQFTFTFPPYPAFSHIVVFLLPGNVLPEGSAAGVYIRIPPALLQRRNAERQRQQQQQQQQQRGGVQDDDVVVLDTGDDLMVSSAAAAASSAVTSAAAAAVTATEEAREGEFTFLGAIANDKQSAIFRVRIHDSVSGNDGMMNEPDEDAMVDESMNTTAIPGQGREVANAQGPEDMTITLGISLEPIANISSQLSMLRSSKASDPTMNPSSIPTSSSSALIPLPSRQTAPPPDPQYQLQLARKIITNAFNFLASFGTSASTKNAMADQQQQQQQQQEEEMVPLRAFRDWWNKFEKKLMLDPAFLEREDG